MSKYHKISLISAAIVFTGSLVYKARQANTQKRIMQVSNEGYETAPDVLYPKENKRFKKLHLGPVLPHHSL
jgi:hypothetical protein